MKSVVLMIFVCSKMLFSYELITPIPKVANYHHEKALLGKKLFFDVRLSRDNSVSCASCHLLDDGGDDNLRVSVGVNGNQGTRNSPTVLNARYNAMQLWDGSAESLMEQARGPIHDPNEMSSNFEEIISKLRKDKTYTKIFSQLYSDGIAETNILDVISEFEKALTTPNAKFDNYLRGDKSALSNDELEGYKLFKEYGCISCHNGVNIGGNLMQKIGVIEEIESPDLGMFTVTKDKEDKHYFKVPSLRNVALTAPYFHNGSGKTLKSAVERMVKHQVGYLLEDEDIDKIIKFLKTLTGDKPKILESQDEK